MQFIPNPDILKGVYFGVQPRLTPAGLEAKFQLRLSASPAWGQESVGPDKRLEFARLAWKAVASPEIDLAMQFLPVSLFAAAADRWESYTGPASGFLGSCPDAWLVTCLRYSQPVSVLYRPKHSHPDVVRVAAMPVLPLGDWLRFCRMWASMPAMDRAAVRTSLPVEPAVGDFPLLALRSLSLAYLGLESPLADVYAESKRVVVPACGCDFSHSLAVFT